MSIYKKWCYMVIKPVGLFMFDEIHNEYGYIQML